MSTFTSVASSSASSTYRNTAGCQDDITSVVAMYGVSVLAIAVWSLLGLFLQCCCLSLDGAPSLAAQFYGVVGGVQLGMVLYSVTMFFPNCPDSCHGQCNRRELMWFYLVPAIEAMVGLCWCRASWNRAQLARALTRDTNGDNNDAIFAKVPTHEDDATQMELTDYSETEEEIQNELREEIQ